jgi:uncharacterized protein (TIGR03083 family)
VIERDAMGWMGLARDERADFAAFLARLSPADWDRPTLCEGWRVRDVVAHVISYDDLDGRGLIKRLARGWFLPARVNAAGIAELAERGPRELLDLLNDRLEPRGLTAGFGGRIALVDGLIHHQDVRRPLGRPRDIPADRMRTALDFARVAPPIGAFWRARGLRLIATDLEWAAGKGPEVTGKAESLLMAISGRPGVVHELAGSGRATLAARVER